MGGWSPLAVQVGNAARERRGSESTVETGKCNARTISTLGRTYTPDVKHGDVVKVGAERDPVDVRRRNSVLDLHRPLVHDQH